MTLVLSVRHIGHSVVHHLLYFLLAAISSSLRFRVVLACINLAGSATQRTGSALRSAFYAITHCCGRALLVLVYASLHVPPILRHAGVTLRLRLRYYALAAVQHPLFFVLCLLLAAIYSSPPFLIVRACVCIARSACDAVVASHGVTLRLRLRYYALAAVQHSLFLVLCLLLAALYSSPPFFIVRAFVRLVRQECDAAVPSHGTPDASQEACGAISYSLVSLSVLIVQIWTRSLPITFTASVLLLYILVALRPARTCTIVTRAARLSRYVHESWLRYPDIGVAMLLPLLGAGSAFLVFTSHPCIMVLAFVLTFSVPHWQASASCTAHRHTTTAPAPAHVPAASTSPPAASAAPVLPVPQTLFGLEPTDDSAHDQRRTCMRNSLTLQCSHAHVMDTRTRYIAPFSTHTTNSITKLHTNRHCFAGAAPRGPTVPLVNPTLGLHHRTPAANTFGVCECPHNGGCCDICGPGTCAQISHVTHCAISRRHMHTHPQTRIQQSLSLLLRTPPRHRQPRHRRQMYHRAPVLPVCTRCTHLYTRPAN